MARDADVAAEEPVAPNGWRERAQQWLSARAGAASARAQHVALAAADACIASLERLRQRAGAAGDADESRDQERERRGKRAPAARRGGNPAVEQPIAPQPRRRLRGLLVYLAVMLAGAMVGTLLAYDLLERLLERRAVEVKRHVVKLEKYSKSVAVLEKKLEQEQAKQLAAETRLVAASAEQEKKLGELQAKQVDAEARLAGALALRANAPQAQPDTGASRDTGVSRDTGASRDTTRYSRGGWTRSGDCTLGGANVRSALSGCIADMNRK